MILLERNYKWLPPILSFVISLILFVFTYWAASKEFMIREMLGYPITYLYFIYFNGTVYLSIKLSKFFYNIKYFQIHTNTRLFVELMSLFAMSFIFFYVTLITSSVMSGRGDAIIFTKNNTIIGVFQGLVLLLYSSLTITQDFLNKWRQSSIEISELQKQKLRAENRALQAHLNPHFLFNSLNVLISEIDYDPKSAKRFALDLSTIYRYVLNSKDKELVSFKEEWEVMQGYIHLHQVRLGEGLIFESEIHKDSLDKKIPPLSLQLLLENCFKHNQATLRKPLHLSIISDTNKVIVKNNVQLKSQKPESYNIGLKYLNDSFHHIDSNATVKIEQNENEFIVEIPLLTIDK
ncbi:sensor histidine kinase [Flammeovirga agarivorans]|uniref:Histidine kinase n=1 Tax=Flammeovirga agarivorans TaxID=2726742 RepID=A0A7X8SNS1_9BACT|nr:histidine kinase [Flammeovirga agarivorans]NLR93535.1 histidine kinase [Flammeovirga agarivorans]